MNGTRIPSVKELRDKTMTPEKATASKNDVFAFYIGRPISYVLTIPFLALGMRANTVSFLSLFPSLLGFMFLGFGTTVPLRIIGCLLFLLWNFMDGVDGNIARFTETASPLGRLWDATSGYFAMTLFYFAMGLSAYTDQVSGLLSLQFIPPYIYIVLGALTSMFLLLARLVMHKKMLLLGEQAGAKLTQKQGYSPLKIFYLNITSVSGFITIFMMVSVLLHLNGLMTVGYFCVHTVMLCSSLFQLLRDDAN